MPFFFNFRYDLTPLYPFHQANITNLWKVIMLRIINYEELRGYSNCTYAANAKYIFLRTFYIVFPYMGEGRVRKFAFLAFMY